MIKKLKRRFILLAGVSTLLLMTVLVGAMNMFNFSSVTNEADRTLQMLAELSEPSENAPKKPNAPFEKLPRGMSPEVPYESRFFFVTVEQDGTLLRTDTSRIISVDEAQARAYTAKALESRRTNGFLDRFRYYKITESDRMHIYFLDCGRKLDSFYSFLRISFSIALFGGLLVFVAFWIASDRIIHPIAQSYLKQKRFITDAGHEIKTPLTIIGANADLLEAQYGEDESVTDIRQQVERLGDLTQRLIYLARMDESENILQKIEFPLSDLVEETAEGFKRTAMAQGTPLELQVTQGQSMQGDPEAIRQLMSVLFDNAVKYAKPDTPIVLSCKPQGKSTHLTVTNQSKMPLDAESLSHVFERFYRPDASRNSETGGHGIGLSIAEAIVRAHGGTIRATTQSGEDFCVSITI